MQVTGFSVRGRVVDSQGAGIGGVKIVIEDVERATTDAQGYYKLDQVMYSAHAASNAHSSEFVFPCCPV